MTTAPRLSWKRDDFGTYADSPTMELRYYVRKEGTGRAPWLVEAVPTIVTAGVRSVKPGTNPRWADRYNPSRAIAQAIAHAYEVEPDAGTANRLTRAIDRAYRETP